MSKFEQGDRVIIPLWVPERNEYAPLDAEFLSYQGEEYFERNHSYHQAAFVKIRDASGQGWTLKVPAEFIVGWYDEDVVEELLESIHA